MDPEARIGDLVEGRYRVDRVVGRGGFGVVYEARHLVLDMRVALKVLALPDDMSAEAKLDRASRLMAEARLLSRLRHPNVVAAVDSGILPDDAGTTVEPYLVVEWCDGPTLKTWLAEQGRAGDPRGDLQRAWTLVSPIASAIAAAHVLGVVHRDLKPSNVMLARDGSGLVPMLIDFGIAKTFAEGEPAGAGDTRTDATFRPYTPAYAAPEQIAGARTGPWTDVHGLALLFTEIATGRAPYERAEAGLAAIDPQRPTPARFGVDAGAFEPVLARALALRPADRYPDGAAFAAALAEAAAAEGLAPASALVEIRRAARAATGLAPERTEADERTANPASVTIASQRSRSQGSAARNARRRLVVVASVATAVVATGIGATLISLRGEDASPSETTPSPAPAVEPLATLKLGDLESRVGSVVHVISTSEVRDPTVFYGEPYEPSIVTLASYPVPSDEPRARDELRSGLIDALRRSGQDLGLHYAVLFDGPTTLTIRDRDRDRLVRVLDAISAGKRSDRRELLLPSPSDQPPSGSLAALSPSELRGRLTTAGFDILIHTRAGSVELLSIRKIGSAYIGTLKLYRFGANTDAHVEEQLAVARALGRPFSYARSGDVLLVVQGLGGFEAGAALDTALAGLDARVERWSASAK